MEASLLSVFLMVSFLEEKATTLSLWAVILRSKQLHNICGRPEEGRSPGLTTMDGTEDWLSLASLVYLNLTASLCHRLALSLLM